MSALVPLVVCGAKKEVATAVRASLLPEYDVVYGGHDFDGAAKEVPQIISGSPPPASSLHTQVGSNDFTVFPRAVITGGGYSDEAFQTLYQACEKACGGQENLPVPFFRVDNALTDKLEAEGKGPPSGSPEYSKFIAQRLKDKLREAGVGAGVQERPENKGKLFFF